MSALKRALEEQIGSGERVEIILPREPELWQRALIEQLGCVIVVDPSPSPRPRYWPPGAEKPPRRRRGGLTRAERRRRGLHVYDPPS